jgi:hypothetical protein
MPLISVPACATASGHGSCVSGFASAACLKARAAPPGSGDSEPVGAFLMKGGARIDGAS